MDVRDVAMGHLLAAQQGRSGERHILGGENMSYSQFFRALAGAAGRRIFRLRLPTSLGPILAGVNDRLLGNRPRHAYLTAAQARLLGLYFYCSSARAQRGLGYRARPIATSLAEAYRFWCAPGAR